MSEDRDFPVLGRPYIVKLKGVWQEQIYIADQADGEMCPGERFWSREDLDECPSFDYEHDDWISIREAVSNRGQLAALKEENERLKEEFKMSEYSANLANICREEWKTSAIEYGNEVVALKARVAELERAVHSVEDLIQNSDGVAGLHMNGDIAEWSSLLAGGSFEEWLIDYSAAASTLK